MRRSSSTAAQQHMQGVRHAASGELSARGPLVLPLEHLGSSDVGIVGGKNASLGEMLRHLRELKIEVPGGFATTAAAYRLFVDENGLRQPIVELLARLKRGKASLPVTGAAIRKLILSAEMPVLLTDEIQSAYVQLCIKEKRKNLDVAVRSSATAEDLPTASFAGQLESFLNIRGSKALLGAVQRCFASLFTDRAISYREIHGFDHMAIALSVGVQRMVRSDRAGSGVIFTIDTETGFPHTVLVTAAWGLGEYVVQGVVDPDQYSVFKPSLADSRLIPIIDKQLGTKARKLIYGRGSRPTRDVRTTRSEQGSFVLEDDEILQLARWATAIESHYGRPMDIEWAKDGHSRQLYIVQARPETVESRRIATSLKTYTLKGRGKPLVTGLAVGTGIASGRVCRLTSLRDAHTFTDGAILVTEQTDPDWGPLMKRARAIVTTHGGRTSHAAIVSRELGLPAIVGASGATKLLRTGQVVTVSCAEGDQGFVYAGALAYEEHELSLDTVPKTRTKVMLNMADPAAALRWWRLPADGIGLARMEFVVSNHVKVHPLALARFGQVKDARARKQITLLTRGYRNKADYFVEMLARGIARLAVSQWPQPIVLRMSDFKTNEYAKLIGGAGFEPKEPNPMIGWRGASRYYDARYRDGFALECRAVRKVRKDMGLANVIVMIPFCRTLGEADRVLQEMTKNGLKRGEAGLEVYVMCEIPSNVILAEEFAKRFDGFSIGSNDLTQLTLGVDRDSALLRNLFDEEDPAVKALIADLIARAHKVGAHVGFCGQAPSDRPTFARFLVASGIDAVSVTPDSFLQVKKQIAAAERGARPRKFEPYQSRLDGTE